MNRRFFAALSGMGLCALLAAPVFAMSTGSEMGPDLRSPTECRDEHLPVYKTALSGNMAALRTSIMNEWKRQEDFRINAATTAARKVTIKRALDRAGVQLNAAIDIFVRAQTTAISSDVAILINTYSSDDVTASDAVFNGWTDRTVSFRALDAALARAETSLRTYAVTRDRVIITNVWTAMRKQVESTFVDRRMDAREDFKTGVENCVNGVSADDTRETDSVSDDTTDTDAVSTETPAPKPPATTAPIAPLTIEPRIDASVTVVDGDMSVTTCGAHTFFFVGTITSNKPGIVKYHWLRSDGATTGVESIEFMSAGTKTVSYSWNKSGTNYDSVRLIIDAPVSVSAQTNVKLTQNCAIKPEATVPPVSTTDSSYVKPIADPAPMMSALVTDVQAQISTKAEVSLCGTYTFQFKGSVKTTGPTNVNFRWERSDGVNGPERKFAFDAAGSWEVSPESWSLSGDFAGYERLHVLVPVDMFSAPVPIKITQVCK